MRARDRKVLVDELPALVDAELVTEKQAARIKEHYSTPQALRPNAALIAFSILGSILLAAGIILILAHNWSDIPRAIRTIIAFLPLVAGQIVGGWVLMKRPASLPWKEGVASFSFLAVGAAIALVSQIYHIAGGMESYLLVWMLLAVPLVYVYGSVTAAELYGVGITAWAIAERVAGGTAAGFWLFLAALAPACFVLRRRSPLSSGLLTGTFCISLVCGGTLATGSVTQGSWVLVMLALFQILFAAGALYSIDDAWRTPPYRIGLLGLCVTYAVLSFRGLWEHLSYTVNADAAVTSYLGTGVVGIVCVTASVTALMQGAGTIVTAGPVLAGLPLALACFAAGENHWVPALVLSVYVFGLGVAALVRGLHLVSGRTVNFGFLLVAVAVLLRFFDSEWSFTVRGIAFAALGAGFLIANVFVARRKGART